MGTRILRDGVQRSPRAGWQRVHATVDDHSRFAYAEVRRAKRRPDGRAFLERRLRWFGDQSIAVEVVMTDISRSTVFLDIRLGQAAPAEGISMTG